MKANSQTSSVLRSSPQPETKDTTKRKQVATKRADKLENEDKSVAQRRKTVGIKSTAKNAASSKVTAKSSTKAVPKSVAKKGTAKKARAGSLKKSEATRTTAVKRSRKTNTERRAVVIQVARKASAKRRKE